MEISRRRRHKRPPPGRTCQWCTTWLDRIIVSAVWNTRLAELQETTGWLTWAWNILCCADIKFGKLCLPTEQRCSCSISHPPSRLNTKYMFINSFSITIRIALSEYPNFSEPGRPFVKFEFSREEMARMRLILDFEGSDNTWKKLRQIILSPDVYYR